jgi:hypothetical protein
MCPDLGTSVSETVWVTPLEGPHLEDPPSRTRNGNTILDTHWETPIGRPHWGNPLGYRNGENTFGPPFEGPPLVITIGVPT